MREKLKNEIMMALIGEGVDTDEITDTLTALLDKYEVTNRHTELIPYNSNKTAEYLRLYLMNKMAAGRTRRTLDYYKRTLILFFQEVQKSPTEVTSDDIKMYLAQKDIRDGVSKRTQNNIRRCLSSFFTWMQKEEHIVKNPINKVEKIKERQKPKYAFTDMDIEKMRLQIGDNLMLRCMFEMFLSTWCRVSELANMKISEIAPNLESVTVHGKGNKDRKCYINETAKLYLQKYISERKDNNDYLFPSSVNEGETFTAFPTRTLQKECSKRHLKKYDWWKIPELIGEGHKDRATIEEHIRRLGKKAGVEKAHPHRFRRTGATFALRKGMPIEIVSKLLGHESIETTQIYLDVSEDSLEQFHRKYV